MTGAKDIDYQYRLLTEGMSYESTPHLEIYATTKHKSIAYLFRTWREKMYPTTAAIIPFLLLCVVCTLLIMPGADCVEAIHTIRLIFNFLNAYVSITGCWGCSPVSGCA